ncbi:MAG: thiamine pyrophosphate-binding protein [Clostridia bacterium]|nr:thiamine pyrophosphate-binding protein [Clostridia bacterium]
MRGSDLIVRILIESGVKVCFGYPGSAVMPLYDALYRHRRQIRHIRTAHEQGAAHAADGFARASGKLGVCIATSGPGATNLVTGIATAFADSVPVLFITANVNLDEIGTDSFQEADIAGITLPITKYNWTVRSPGKLESTFRKAVMLAMKGRPGPVLVDVPRDILEYDFGRGYKTGSGTEAGDFSEMRSPEPGNPSNETVEALARAINEAERPFIVAGGGVRISGAWDEIAALAEKAKIPVATTLMACGALPDGNPLSFGMAGKYGSPETAALLREADTVICVGMRFSNRTHESFSDDRTILHIDSDASEVNKNVAATVSAVGDAKEILARILPLVNKRRSAWTKKREISGDINCETSGFSDPVGETGSKLRKDVFEPVARTLGGDAFVVTDVGLHQMAAARFYPFEKPGRFITSGGFGTMGFGLGAAIGSSLAAGENGSGVVLFTGDGSFRMDLTELSTLRENNVKILVVVLNNSSLGMVRDIQKNEFGGRYIATAAQKAVPDFKRIATAYGLSGFTANTPEEFKKALESFANGKRSCVIDYRMKF